MPDTKTEILSRINVRSYYEQFVTIEKEDHKNYLCKCPFHNDKDPSLAIEKTSGKFYCFGCHKCGDVITFQMEFKHQSFKEAEKELAEFVGYKEYVAFSSESKKEYTQHQHQHPPLEEEELKKLQENLNNNNEVKDYLINTRKIGQEVITKIGLGLFDKYIVYPIRKEGKLHTYRFYNRIPIGNESKIWQISGKELKYNPVWLFPEPDTTQEKIYLFEGEMDCLCALSLGLNATTGTGGSKTWREEWNEFFRDKIVYICYDIDQSGIEGRIIAASEISKVAKEVFLVDLDLDIEKYPNGDFNDYIAKESNTLENFMKLVDRAERFYKQPEGIDVVEVGTKYYKKIEKRNGECDLKEISDFVLRLKTILNKEIEEDHTVIHRIVSIKQNKKETGLLELAPKKLANIKDFREVCIGAGDFVFTGTEVDLSNVCKLLFCQSVNKSIFDIRTAGYDSKHGIWIFKDLIIKDGKIYEADNKHICWNGDCGYRCLPLNGNLDELEEERSVPNIQKYDGGMTKIVEFAETLEKNYGTPMVKLGIGLAIGSVFYKEIVRDYSNYPISFVFGPRQAGKTRYIGILMRLFGMDQNSYISLPGVPSIVAISRTLSYNSGVPVWIDECRNDLITEKMAGFFRSVYDSTGRKLGTKKKGVVLSEKVKSPLILSGQEKPTDEALLSRMILIDLKEKRRKNELYEKVIQLADESSSFICKLILEKDRLYKVLRNRIDDISSKIKLRRGNDNTKQREITNFAIALGLYVGLLEIEDPLLEDEIINNTEHYFADAEVSEGCKEMTTEFEQILSDLQVAASEKKKDPCWYRFNGNEVYVWFDSLYKDFMAMRLRTGQKKVDIQQIYSNMKDMNGFLDKRKKVRIPENGGIPRSCILLDINKVPDSVKSWFPVSEWEQSEI